MTAPRSTDGRSRALLLIAALVAGTLALGAVTQNRVASARTDSPSAGATDGTLALSATLDRAAVLRGGDGLVRLELAIESLADRGPTSTRVPTDLVVILDRSGSMQGEKIRQARAAIHQLISRLERRDRFGLVTFSSEARTPIPLTRVHPETSAVWSAAVDAIRAGGGTFMSNGLDLGLDMIDAARVPGRAPRVILISDGLAAEAPDSLRAQASRAAAGEYALSAVGVGSDFDEALLASLADAGTGNYHYLAGGSLAEIFSREFETASDTVATGLAVFVTPKDGVAVVDAAGYPLERSARGVAFRPGSLFAGQKRRVWVTFRVPTDSVGERALAGISLDYAAAGERHRLSLDALPRIACVGEERDFYASLDPDGWERSVVVEEYNAVQQKVAALVREGRRERALAEIVAFRAANAPLNEQVAAPDVARRLDDTLALERDVREVFEGSEQAHRQNLLAKRLHALAVSERREGSLK